MINAAAAVQAIRVAQYAACEQEQDPTGAWVEVEHPLGHVNEFAPDCFGPMLDPGDGRVELLQDGGDHVAAGRRRGALEGICTWTDPHGRQYQPTRSTTTSSPPDEGTHVHQVS